MSSSMTPPFKKGKEVRFRILHKPVFSALEVELGERDRVVVEAGGMAYMDPTVKIETEARGGLMAALKRSLVGREAFFMNTFHGPGKIVLAPPYSGDIHHMPLESGETWFIQSGSYVASSPKPSIDTKFVGLRGILAEGNLFFLKIDGQETSSSLPTARSTSASSLREKSSSSTPDT